MAKKSTSKPKGIIPSDVRGRTVRPLSQTVDKLTKSMLGRQGFTHGAIVTKWPDIVGDTIARHTAPEKIVFSRDGVSGGTLHLRCSSGALATQLMHQEPQILDRINTFFGYQAVVRIKLIQGPVPSHKETETKAPRPLSEAETRDLAKTIATVDDPELREALENLGKSVLGQDSGKT